MVEFARRQFMAMSHEKSIWLAKMQAWFPHHSAMPAEWMEDANRAAVALGLPKPYGPSYFEKPPVVPSEEAPF